MSQIPALLISIAAGLIVTRAATESDLGTDVVTQFGSQERAMRIAAVSVALIAIIPGLPKLPFFLVAGALWIAADAGPGPPVSPSHRRRRRRWAGPHGQPRRSGVHRV